MVTSHSSVLGARQSLSRENLDDVLIFFRESCCAVLLVFLRTRLFVFSSFSFRSSSSFLARRLCTRHRQIYACIIGRESTLIRADQYAYAYLLSRRSPCTFDSEILFLLKGRRLILSFVSYSAAFHTAESIESIFCGNAPALYNHFPQFHGSDPHCSVARPCLDFDGRSQAYILPVSRLVAPWSLGCVE
jgi:hypothetical protein